MTKARPLGNAALAAVENAESHLRRAARLGEDGLGDPGLGTPAALLVSRLLNEVQAAQLELAQARRPAQHKEE